MDSYQNPVNLYNRLKEHVKATGELKRVIRFYRNDITITNVNVINAEGLIDMIQEIENETRGRIEEVVRD